MNDSQSPKTTSYPIGRLLVIPLIIVVVIVGCAVVVVLSFGAITSFKEVAVQDLLSRLESTSGERSAGVLMPRDKELWLAAEELALRLEDVQQEISPQELPEVQVRLTQLLRRHLEYVAGQPQEVRRVTFFLMHAAAKAGAPDAVPLLIGAAGNDLPDVQREALRALAWMGQVPHARASAVELLPLLDDDSDVIRIFTCVVLANLADRENERVCQELLRVSRRLDHSQEVRWNAVLALARFGYDDPDGWIADQTCEMLDRNFWEGRRVQYTSEEPTGSTRVDRAFEPIEIEHRLWAALDAAEHLGNPRVRACVGALTHDESLKIASRARQAVRPDSD